LQPEGRQQGATAIDTRTTFRSDCPIASSLDVIGDKWTLVIIRDMAFGKARFSEFLGSGEGIKRNILADRLKRMEAGGLIGKTPYQTRPTRYAYRLTRMGADLLPAIQHLARWGRKYLPHAYEPPAELLAWTPESLLD
jgi:DNA-binding HxlR family transcriptional regulator